MVWMMRPPTHPFLLKFRRKVASSSMADPERGLWEGPNFKQVPQFLKSNQILPVYGVTSNKGQTCIDINCFAFLLYRGICQLCSIFGHFEGMTAFGPLGSAYEGNGFPTPVNTYMFIPTEFKDDIFTDHFKSANSPLHKQIISQIQRKRSGVGVEAV